LRSAPHPPDGWRAYKPANSQVYHELAGLQELRFNWRDKVPPYSMTTSLAGAMQHYPDEDLLLAMYHVPQVSVNLCNTHGVPHAAAIREHSAHLLQGGRLQHTVQDCLALTVTRTALHIVMEVVHERICCSMTRTALLSDEAAEDLLPLLRYGWQPPCIHELSDSHRTRGIYFFCL